MEKYYIQLIQWNIFGLKLIATETENVNVIATKLNWANAMLYKVRNFVNANILKSIYYALFGLHINYDSIIWEQGISTVNRFYILQKKALRITNFKERNTYSSPVSHYSKVTQIADKVMIDANNNLRSIFTNWFPSSSVSHNYQTSFTSNGFTSSYLPPKQHCMEKTLLSTWL